MTLNTGLTTLHEDDIAKHQAVAQSLVTKLVILERDEPSAGTPLAGTGRRFVSTVSTGGQRRTRQQERHRMKHPSFLRPAALACGLVLAAGAVSAQTLTIGVDGSFQRARSDD